MRTIVPNTTTGPRLLAGLVPDVTVLDVQVEQEVVLLTVTPSSTTAACPRCSTESARIHSYYIRQPHDLPISGRTTRLLVHARRFRCVNPACLTVTFAERLPNLVALAAQRTVRLNAELRDLALAFGGEAGARQSVRSAMPVSADTLLRRAHSAAPPARPTPRVLGIDDFSFRRGQVFGTILTDGESHEVVDLLPDRTAETAATWLQEHAGVEIVTRDRSADYARAISTGVPHAVQVADRFHLAKNAGEVLERVVQRNHEGLRLAAKAVDQERAQQTASTTDEMQPLPQPRPYPQPTTESSVQGSPARQRRLARYQEVIALAAAGLGPKAIADRVGLARQTVAIWLRAGSFLERPPSAARRMLITPYEPYLRERWQAGEQNSRQLWREIQAQGFRGGSETVRRLTVRWHTERGRSGPPPKDQASKPTPRRAPPAPTTRPLSPRQARWLLLKPEAELKPEQRLYLEHLGRSCPEVLDAQQLVLVFLQLVRKREPASLELWIASAKASSLPELVEFAKGIVRDQDAVMAALEHEWSNGVTEGHVNRLKMIKRTAYGRASFKLLRQRVLAQV
jgi:transposase